MENKTVSTTEVWSNSIRWSLVAAFALLPLVMSAINYDAYDLPKAIVLYTLTLVILVSYLAYSLLSGGITIKRNPLNKPLFAFAIMVTIATFASPIVLISLIGEYARYENLPTFYAYIILCFMAGQFMNKKEWLDRLLVASAISFGIIAIYGILQYLGLDFLPPVMRGFEGRSRSTLGNPVFLGGYIATMGPIFFNYFLDRKENIPGLPKWIVAPLLGLGFITVIFSGSRGAWIGAAVGILAVIILQRKQLLRAVATAFSVSVISTAIALLILLAAGNSVLVGTVNSLQERITTAANPSAGTGASRVEIWKSSLGMISVRPLVGYGPDQMYVWSPAFNTLRKAQLEKNTIPDRAHNIFLQAAINGGLISMLIFLWLVIILIATGLKLIKKESSTTGFAMGALAGIAGYLVQGMSGIDVIGITAPVWVLGGTIASLYPYNKSLRSITIPLKTKYGTAIIGAASLAASVLFIFSLKPLIADIYYLNGITNRYYNQPNQAIINLSNAVGIFPYQSQYRRDLTVAMIAQGNVLKDPNLLEQAIDVSNQGLRYNPQDFDLLLAQASAYRVYAAMVNEQALIGQAEQCYGQAITLNPYSTNPRRGLLGLLMVQQKYPDAIEQAKIILQIDPEDSEVKYRLAQAYEKTGKYGRAKRIYSELLQKYPNRSDIKAALSNLE
ncbi:MAG: O-antigen ligase family protein [Firmicutes bacterium]|nr:O-antigen ligase family protein [Bacillota bacterium]